MGGERGRRLLRKGGLIVGCGIATGVAVAVAAFPAAALTGLVAKSSADELNTLPGELRVQPLPERTYVYAADGKTLITSFFEENRKYVPLKEVAPVVQRAIVAAEDTRFYHHRGVDFRGVVRAFVANRRAGEVRQGASTLTMQYVRNMLIYSARTPAEVRAATAQTAGRKLREMRYAIRLEEELSKDDILERYLNIAYFGHRAYGIAAASYVYFSKPPKALTLGEAATLAGLVKAPSAYDPAKDRGAARERRDWVLDRMVEDGYATAAESAAMKKKPIVLKLRREQNDCVSVSRNDWGFFCDLLRNWWLSRPEFGATANERAAHLRRGGWRVVTTLDPRIQAAAMGSVLGHERRNSRYALGVVLVEPGSGRVKAMAVNRTYSLDQRSNGKHSNPAKHRRGIKGNYPNTVNPLLGGGDIPGYQAGSTFKMFTLLAALERGLPLTTTIFAPDKYRSRFHYDNPSSRASCGGRWCPSNDSKAMKGSHTMWAGFGKSVNTYFVQLLELVGAEAAVRMAERLGLRWHDDVDTEMATKHADDWGAFTLGVANTTPLEMANAFATVAADGKYCQATPVLSIADRTGRKIPVPGGCKQAVRPEVARAATDAARCPVGDSPTRGSCGGWSTASRVRGMLDRPVAGKTGTTDDNRAAWFVGYTPNIAAAAFMADPDNIFHAVGGGNSHKPVSVAASSMRAALQGRPVAYFAAPPSRLVGGGPRIGRAAEAADNAAGKRKKDGSRPEKKGKKSKKKKSKKAAKARKRRR